MLSTARPVVTAATARARRPARRVRPRSAIAALEGRALRPRGRHTVEHDQRRGTTVIAISSLADQRARLSKLSRFPARFLAPLMINSFLRSTIV